MRVRIGCAVEVRGGIAVFKVGPGIVTPGVLVQLRQEALEGLAGAEPHVLIGDLRLPTWAIQAADLDAFFDARTGPVEVPAALVVPIGCADMFREHAWSVAQRGIMRKIFTRYDCAENWAKARLALTLRARTAP